VTTINIEGVASSLSGTPAVDNVSIAIRDGEFFTLLGPSGCGKTTLLRMVAGFCELDRGQILLGEQRIDTLPPHKRNTGMVFQNYAVFPNLTVGDNVAYGLRARKVGKEEIRERVARALKLVQLPDHGERWPHQLSGGQLQRVAIARALVIEPHVLLLDEPLSNLDAKLRVEMRGDIRKLQKQLGITVLYVTHDQEEALAVSDRIAVMRAGRIEQVASPRLIYEAPETPFVASFVGTTNLLNGIVRNRDGEFAEIAFAGSVMRTNSSRGKPGDAVVMSLRPEALRLLASGEAVPPGWATLSGTLGDIEYLGPVTRFAVALADGALLHEVEQPSRRRHQHIEPARAGADLLVERHAADGERDAGMQVAPVGLEAVDDLRRQLAGRAQHQHAAGALLRPLSVLGQVVEDGQREGCGLAGAGLRDADHVTAGEHLRDCL
jgi:ABC-type Fe3+/spermidine/putrescine transport system ATPase subunit